VQADFSIELGADDERLEVPWSSDDGRLRYYDLKRQPELLLNVAEARGNRDLGEFLSGINSPPSILETAKCDAWLSNQLGEEEAIFGASWKFGSYIDLLFTDNESRFSLERHKQLAAEAAKLLARAPEISAAAEFVVRRCYFHSNPNTDDSSVGKGEPPSPPGHARHSPNANLEGFCISFYLYGYGDDEDEARQRWNIALKVVYNALLQVSVQLRTRPHPA